MMPERSSVLKRLLPTGPMSTTKKRGKLAKIQKKKKKKKKWRLLVYQKVIHVCMVWCTATFPHNVWLIWEICFKRWCVLHNKTFQHVAKGLV